MLCDNSCISSTNECRPYNSLSDNDSILSLLKNIVTDRFGGMFGSTVHKILLACSVSQSSSHLIKFMVTINRKHKLAQSPSHPFKIGPIRFSLKYNHKANFGVKRI